eukprot:1486149-Alexandrium_andersonii.AAC.1
MAAPLALCTELLKHFADGSLSAVSVQKLAAAAGADGWGANNALALRLQQAGARGAHPSSCQRDVFKAALLAGLVRGMPDPYAAYAFDAA